MDMFNLYSGYNTSSMYLLLNACRAIACKLLDILANSTSIGFQRATMTEINRNLHKVNLVTLLQADVVGNDCCHKLNFILCFIGGIAGVASRLHQRGKLGKCFFNTCQNDGPFPPPVYHSSQSWIPCQQMVSQTTIPTSQTCLGCLAIELDSFAKLGSMALGDSKKPLHACGCCQKSIWLFG